MPHWGVEYGGPARPHSSSDSARAAIDAGADMVIGNHPHWVGAMEVYKGKPIWYAPRQPRVRPDVVHPDEQGLTVELTMAATGSSRRGCTRT